MGGTFLEVGSYKEIEEEEDKETYAKLSATPVTTRGI